MSDGLETTDEFAVGRTTFGGATVLSPSGSVTYERCHELGQALQQSAEAPGPTVIVDCRQVALMDSEALELFQEWHGRLQESGGALKLVNLNDVCSDILMATRLIHVLDVCADIKQAVAGD